jgi:HAD superfamily hydrolase (TIGR01549 family)
MTLAGVVLDVDGTLVLSNDAHANAWVHAFDDYGYEVSFEQIRPLIGMGGDKIIPQLAPGLCSEEGVGEQISDRRKALILDKYRDRLSPTRGARDLVQKMQREGLRLIIASSATKQEMKLLLEVAQVNDLLPDYVTSDDAKASKPSPDLVEAALRKANLSPKQTVMLGDTPYDVESAARVGVGVIALRSGGFNDEALKGAIAIYNDPADLLEHYDRSPLDRSL